MRRLDAFDGLVGYRWGALFTPEGTLRLSAQAPADSDKKAGFIKRLIESADPPLDAADLHFEKGKVVLRRGRFGLLLLFCDNAMNTSMLSLVPGYLLQDEVAPAHVEEDPHEVDHEAGTQSIRLIHHPTEEPALVPADVIDDLLALYTTFLGPLAAKLAAREARQHGLALDQVPAGAWSRLLNLLAARIGDAAKQDGFLDQAVMLKTRF